MLRRFVFVASLTCLVFLGAVTITCGGSNSGSNCTGGPYNVVGNWMLSSGGNSGPGVINSTGLAVFFQTSAATASSAPGDTVVMPSITGACSFSGNATSYNTVLSGGGTESNAVTGNVTSATAISGALSDGTAFTLTPNSPLSGSLTTFTGSMTGTIEGWTGTGNLWQLTFSATGTGASMSFNGSSADGCNVSGTFNQEGGNLSTLNVFDVSITYTGTNCPATDTVTAVGFESSTDYFSVTGTPQATGTYLYAASSSSASVFELFPSGL